LKRSLTILLAFAFLFQSLSLISQYSAFLLNQKYIAGHLCVNRDKPHSCCHGKCQLIKQISESESRQQSPLLIKDVQILLFWEQNTPVIAAPEQPVITKYAELTAGPCRSVSGSLFRPPQPSAFA
jgi:hypothetical protein